MAERKRCLRGVLSPVCLDFGAVESTACLWCDLAAVAALCCKKAARQHTQHSQLVAHFRDTLRSIFFDNRLSLLPHPGLFIPQAWSSGFGKSTRHGGNCASGAALKRAFMSRSFTLSIPLWITAVSGNAPGTLSPTSSLFLHEPLSQSRL